jgi:hypothetical protein
MRQLKSLFSAVERLGLVPLFVHLASPSELKAKECGRGAGINKRSPPPFPPLLHGFLTHTHILCLCRQFSFAHFGTRSTRTSFCQCKVCQFFFWELPFHCKPPCQPPAMAYTLYFGTSDTALQGLMSARCCSLPSSWKINGKSCLRRYVSKRRP